MKKYLFNSILFLGLAIIIALPFTQRILGATSYQFKSSAYKEIKGTDGTIYSYVGTGDLIDWNENIIKNDLAGYSLFKNNNSFKTNDRYYISIASSELNKSGQTNIEGTLVHMWRTWLIKVKTETFAISIKQPEGLKTINYAWQDTKPATIKASDGKKQLQ